MRDDPEILPKIAQLSDQHGIDASTIIALLAMNALATVDFGGLAFWADAAQTVGNKTRPN